MATKDGDTHGWPKHEYIYRSFEDVDEPRWPFGPEKHRFSSLGVSYDAPEKIDNSVPVGNLSQTIKTAKPALVYYNRRHNTDYVLVDPINSNAFIRAGKIWYHSSFTTKSETSAKASTVLFFLLS
ncbi:hypothetical protein RND81_14G167900 [Saponaria officinalis]|uniref:DUF3615 domain-containing protein n=1 Tax=Saponaria officinalis TaxID=3572 RepID=A0AAW1GRC3_SAPOF